MGVVERLLARIDQCEEENRAAIAEWRAALKNEACDETENPACTPAHLAGVLMDRIRGGLSEGSAAYRIGVSTELRRLLSEHEIPLRAQLSVEYLNRGK